MEDLASIGTTNIAIDLFYGLDDYYTLMNNLDFDSNRSYREAVIKSFGLVDRVRNSTIKDCYSTGNII